MAMMGVMTSSSQTTRQLFDFGWEFTHNGTTQTVDLPHDWDIFEGPNSGKGATGTARPAKASTIKSLELRV